MVRMVIEVQRWIYSMRRVWNGTVDLRAHAKLEWAPASTLIPARVMFAAISFAEMDPSRALFTNSHCVSDNEDVEEKEKVTEVGHQKDGLNAPCGVGNTLVDFKFRKVVLNAMGDPVTKTPEKLPNRPGIKSSSPPMSTPLTENSVKLTVSSYLPCKVVKRKCNSTLQERPIARKKKCYDIPTCDLHDSQDFP